MQHAPPSLKTGPSSVRGAMSSGHFRLAGAISRAHARHDRACEDADGHLAQPEPKLPVLLVLPGSSGLGDAAKLGHYAGFILSGVGERRLILAWQCCPLPRAGPPCLHALLYPEVRVATELKTWSDREHSRRLQSHNLIISGDNFAITARDDAF
ncbi:MAG: hypothetical protein M3Y22_06680 [Pseudomonadota bacterium]|nr:hypothetical protein [Pseudomonadota bacterium]